jgi:hypothetical protein
MRSPKRALTAVSPTRGLPLALMKLAVEAISKRWQLGVDMHPASTLHPNGN